MNAYDIAYTKISLQTEIPMKATEAFDEACGYRTEAQCAAISRAIQNDDKAALMALMTELYALAIHRNEELADIERDEATGRADDLYTAFKDAYPMPAFPALLRVQA